MTEAPTPAPLVQPGEALKMFNEFQAQSRARGEATLKLVMSLSGAMLTLTVGAVLSGNPARIPSSLVGTLQLGWVCLFASIALSLVLMCSMIIATFHMGVRWHRLLLGGGPAFDVVATWNWLRVLNAVVAVGVLLSFLAGLFLVAQVALGVAAGPAGFSQPSAATPPVLGSASRASR